jgi:regulator of sigma E protease
VQLVREWLSSGWAIAMVILGLGLIIFIHELGHFLMAKKNKVRVEIFSLGFALGIPRLVLWKRKWGDTEYRICAMPFGGYVKMAGETLVDLERKGDPGELMAKTPWQRFQIFVAGAVMNLLIALPIATAAYLVGKYETSNQVGVPGVAETAGGMEPGDEIVEVDGRKITNLDKFRIEMIRRANGTVVPVKVLRGGKPVTLQITARKSMYHQTFPTTLFLMHVLPGSQLAAAGVRDSDEITALDGEPIYSGAVLDSKLRAMPGKKVKLSFRRRAPDLNDTETYDREFTLGEKTWYVLPQDDNLVEPIVGRVETGVAAYEFLEPDDVITSIDGKKIRSWQDLKDIVEVSVRTPLRIAVLRKGETKEFTITPSYREGGKGALGIGPKLTNVFAHVIPDSYYGKAGLKDGDRLFSIDGIPGALTIVGSKDGPRLVGLRDTKPHKISIQVMREKAAKTVSIELETVPQVEADLEALGLTLTYSKPFRKRAFGDAIAAGLAEPYDLVVMTFDVLKKLVTGGESPKGLSGPLGIMGATYEHAKLSFGNFLWLLCLITVNLGVFNLLPIPVLDGGHNVLLLIEVVRKWLGKPPPSEKFVASFQYAGLFFILALFLLVTYNDISRMWGRG